MVLPSWMGGKTRWFIGAAILLLAIALNWPLVVSKGYQNLASHALSVAVTMEEPILLARAEEYAKQAGKYDPRVIGTLHFRLGTAKQQLGLEDRAFVNFEEALESNALPVSLEATLLLQVGLHRMWVGDSHAAADYFQRLLNLDTDQVPALTIAYANVYLGNILGQETSDLILERSYLEKALDLFEDAFTMDRFLDLISRMLKQGGEENFDQALEMAVIATTSQPSNTWPALRRCDVHFARQEMAEATAWCQRACELDQKNQYAHVMLGRVYAQQELWQEALVEYEMAASLDTENNWYRTLAAEARSKISQ